MGNKAMNKKCFVTGSSGFIGTVLCRCLEASGWEVVRHSKRHKVSGAIVWNMGVDKFDGSQLQGVDTVIHLAGLAHDISNKLNLIDYKMINTDCTVDLALKSAQNGITNFIYVSSVKAQNVEEDSLGLVTDVYAESKKKSETQLLSLCDRVSMRINIVRPALVYGPGVKGNIQLMRNGIVAGWFPALPAVGNKKSLIHVDDLSRILAILASSGLNRSVIIASEQKPYSARSIYIAICVAEDISPRKVFFPGVVVSFLQQYGGPMRRGLNKIFGNSFYPSNTSETLDYDCVLGLKDLNHSVYD